MGGLAISLFALGVGESFSQTQPSKPPANPTTKQPAAQPSAAAQNAKAAPKTPQAQSKAQAAKKKQVAQKRKANKAKKQSFARSEQGYNSMGTRLGLRSAFTEVALNSSAVLVVDQVTGQVLLEKNPDVALPIASITKVMTALVVMDAELPLHELITITKDDTKLQKYSRSRLTVGSKFTRAELLHLALMSSDNRAAHALGRTYPEGLAAFVAAMNDKADELSMTQSKFVEPTGLSNENRSTPRDLARLVNAAHEHALIRDFSTDKQTIVKVGGRDQQFRNTNALLRSDNWELGLSKTGFIRDAGKCLVMQATIDGQAVVIVMLDAQGSQKRLLDAERIRQWLTTESPSQSVPRS
jgi:D-alanyl-D-alanine endopeptidase (penicillin-binding protein 7)